MKFVVNAALTITVVKIVEAATEAEARAMALDLGVPRLCHQCVSTGNDSRDTWELADGISGEVGEVTECEALP